MITEEDPSQSYFYHTDRIFTNTKDAAKSLISQLVNDGEDWAYAMVEGSIIDQDQLDAALRAQMAYYYRGFSWYQWVDHYGGNTYMVVYWD